METNVTVTVMEDGREAISISGGSMRQQLTVYFMGEAAESTTEGGGVGCNPVATFAYGNPQEEPLVQVVSTLFHPLGNDVVVIGAHFDHRPGEGIIFIVEKDGSEWKPCRSYHLFRGEDALDNITTWWASKLYADLG